MSEYLKSEICDGVTFLCVQADRFKTNEISISFALPLKSDTVSANAVMINLLSRKSNKYKTFGELNKKLAMLYGATLTASVEKNGENQILKIGLTCVDDKFSFDGGSVSLAGLELLTSLVLDPKLENGAFCDDDVQSEKRIILEKIAAQVNDKRAYAVRQLEKSMFKDEPYSINKYGEVQDVNAVTSADVYNAWKSALYDSKILITCVGSIDYTKAQNYLKSSFGSIQRNFKALDSAVFVPVAKEVKTVEEKVNVNQGKLVLGFRVNLKPNDRLVYAMNIFCDIFGGGPYSKLFMNVREKLSLCYYCAARYKRQKSIITIECGCNYDKMDKAVEEIKNQLKEIENGNFQDEFNSSLMAIQSAIGSINDMPYAIENWYTARITDDDIVTPSHSAKCYNSVTIDDIKKCAGLVSLDTVYKMIAEEDNK